MDIGNCTHGFTEEKDPHWNRRDIAGFVSGFEQAAPEVSKREFAREHHIPRSTLQFWIDRKRAIELPAAYLSVAAPKASTAARRREIQAVAEQLTKNIHWPNP